MSEAGMIDQRGKSATTSRVKTAPAKPRSGSDKRQRTEAVRIRLSKEERVEVEELARRAGLSIASFGRNQMLGTDAPRAMRRPPIERELAARLLGQMGKIGSNLNQIARSANMSLYGPSEHREMVDILKQMRAALFETLGRHP